MPGEEKNLQQLSSSMHDLSHNVHELVSTVATRWTNVEKALTLAKAQVGTEIATLRGELQVSITKLQGDVDLLSKDVKDMIGNGKEGRFDTYRKENKEEHERMWGVIRKQSTFRTRMIAIWGVLVIEGTVAAFLAKLYFDIAPYLTRK